MIAAMVAAAALAPAQNAADLAAIDRAIHAVYDVISGPAGQKRDFDKMRSLFAPGATMKAIGPKGLRGGSVEDYILERGIRADLAIVKGWKADESGNLMFRKTARNFNQPAATCGRVCVAEVEEIVPVGSLDPDCIHLPSIYVNRLILGAPYDKKIEFRTVRQREAA